MYLKDFENKDNFQKNDINIDLYSDKDEKTNIEIVIKNNNVYIKSHNNRIQVVDENSSVEFVNEHYKKIDKTIYEEYSYNLDKIIDPRFKVRYGTVNSFFKSCYMRSKENCKLFCTKKDTTCTDFLLHQCLLYTQFLILQVQQI